MISARVQKSRRVSALLPMLVLLFAGGFVMAAQETVPEVEPNGTPRNATGFQGPSLLLGDMTGADQDAFVWTVTDTEVRHRGVDLQFDHIEARLSGRYGHAKVEREQMTARARHCRGLVA